MLKVSPVNFKSGNSSDKNPISKAGETANLAKATFIAGAGLGTKLLFELLDDEFFTDNADKIISTRNSLYNSSGKNNFKNIE